MKRVTCWTLISVVALSMCLKTNKAVAADDFIGPLADIIAASFPLVGMTATPGNDWCVEAEADPNQNAWYMRIGGQYEVDSVVYAKRIPMVYTGASVKAGFASIFLAVDLSKTSYYSLTNIDPGSTQAAKSSSTQAAQPKSATSSSSPPPGKITFPTSTSICPPFADFLRIAFQDDAQYWRLQLDPNCGTAPECKFKVGGKDHFEREDSQHLGQNPNDMDDPLNLLYWNFNGRSHKITGAIRFVIRMCSQPCTDSAGATDRFGFLVVGYGGSGGAG